MAKNFGSACRAMLESRASLVKIYDRQGRYTEARHMGESVMETMRRVLEEEHPVTWTTIGDLARTYHNLKQHERAEHLEIQVMNALIQILGPNHPDTLTSMANLALS